LKKHLAANQGKSATATLQGDRGDLAELVAGIVVHRDRLMIRLKSDNADEASDRPDDRLLTIPWHKPPSKRSRQILLPHNASRSDVRPEQFERRARLVSAIARGRRWLDDVVSGRVTTVAELCTRERCSVRQVNMTISLSFLAPNLVKAAVEGRLPRGIGIGSAIRPPNGADSLRRSDSIRNSCSIRAKNPELRQSNTWTTATRSNSPPTFARPSSAMSVRCST
jgi:site-specific DNA recombinase